MADEYRRYYGDDGLYHDSLECPYLKNPQKSLPVTTALKWGLDPCPECC